MKISIVQADINEYKSKLGQLICKNNMKSVGSQNCMKLLVQNLMHSYILQVKMFTMEIFRRKKS